MGKAKKSSSWAIVVFMVHVGAQICFLSPRYLENRTLMKYAVRLASEEV